MSIFSLLFFPYLTKPLALLVVLSTAFSVFFMYQFGVIIDSDMVRNVFKTDIQEAKDLLSVNFMLFILIFGILPTLFILCCKIEYFGFKKHTKHKLLLLLGGLFLSFGLFLIQTKTLIPFFRANSQARVYNTPFYPIYSLGKYLKQDFSKQPIFLSFSHNAKLAKESLMEKKLMILVVGETARAANYSLGTYTRNSVNEYMEHEEINYFKNFFSCGTSTAISVPCMFSINDKKSFKTREFQENVLDVLQNLGVNVV